MNKQQSQRKALSSSQAKQRPKLKKRSSKFVPKAPVAQVSPYLASVLDPEHHRGVRYPDGFVRKTAMFPGLTNDYIPYFPSTSNNEPPGSYTVIVRPSALHPIWTYGPVVDPGQLSRFVDEQGDYGLFPIDPTIPTISPQVGDMIMQTGVTSAVKAHMISETLDYPQEPYKASSPDGSIFYGNVISGFQSTAARNANATVEIDGNGVLVGDSIQFDWVDSKGGIVSHTVVAGVLGQNIYNTGNIDISALVPADNNPLVASCSARPGVGLRITGTFAAGLAQHVLSIHENFRGTVPAGGMKYFLYPLDLPNIGDILKTVNLARTVSQSALLSYLGADLTNGGQHAALLYRGGEHPNQLNLWNYSGIAETPESYDGPVKTGSYSFWMPSNVKDTEMRSLVNSDEWTHPYIAMAGLMSSPDVINTLRLRTAQNLEIVSTSQLFDYEDVPDDEVGIRIARKVLRMVPSSGPNETHMEMIKSFLGKAASAVKSGVGWVADNAGWLIPAGVAMAALL